MLVLSRHEQEKIRIGKNIWIVITKIRGASVRIGIDAPADVPIVRGELIEAADDLQIPKNAV